MPSKLTQSKTYTRRKVIRLPAFTELIGFTAGFILILYLGISALSGSFLLLSDVFGGTGTLIAERLFIGTILTILLLVGLKYWLFLRALIVGLLLGGLSVYAYQLVTLI